MQVIAEIANSHQGSIKILKKLINKLSKIGIKIIKFQIYFADELLTKNHKRYGHFKSQSFSEKDWKNIIKFSKKKDFKIYVDIFGEKALKLSNKLNIDGFKVHSSDLCNLKILKLLKKSKKLIFLSCGGATGFDIAYAINKLKGKNLVLMHGFQDYPTTFEDNNLKRITWLKQNFSNKNIDFGFQDHTDGNKYSQSILVTSNAITLGAKYIEKHVTLSRDLKIDSSSSLEPTEFKKYIVDINKHRELLGDEEFIISKSEYKYSKDVKKFIVAKKNLKKNSYLKLEDVDFKRVNFDKFTNTPYFEDFTGKKLKKNIFTDEIIRQSDFQNKINALLIVRLNSKRLKKKSVLKINGEYLIEHLIKRVKRINGLNKIILCTSTSRQDDKLVYLAKKNNINFFRGDGLNVLKRIYFCIKKFNCDHILRITGDDILIDKYYAEKTIQTHLNYNSDYTDCKDIPSGTEIEVISTKTIFNLYKNLKDSSGTEYLTNYLTENKDHFHLSSCKVKKEHKSNLRLTIDTIEDYMNVKQILKHFYKIKKINSYDMNDILDFYSLLKKSPKNLNITQLKKPIKYKTKLLWS